MFVILHVQTPASIYSPDVLNVPLTTLVDLLIYKMNLGNNSIVIVYDEMKGKQIKISVFFSKEDKALFMIGYHPNL